MPGMRDSLSVVIVVVAVIVGPLAEPSLAQTDPTSGFRATERIADQSSQSDHDSNYELLVDLASKVRISSIPATTPQVYDSEATWPSTFISNSWTAGYNISSFSGGDGSWTVFMSKRTGFIGQCWASRADFQAAYDWTQGEDCYASKTLPVTEIGHLNGAWVVVASEAVGLTDQTFLLQADFPDDSISIYKDNGYHISDIAYGNDQWAVVFTNMSSFGEQVYEISDDFPTDFVGNRWSDGYYVSEVAFGNGQWVVVMTKLGAGGQQWLLGHNWQEVSIHAALPTLEMETAWSHGLEVLDLVHGDDSYVPVTTTDLSEVMGAPPPAGGVLGSSVLTRSSSAVTFSVDAFAVGSDLQPLGLDRDDFKSCASETRFTFEQTSDPTYYLQSDKGSYSATFLFDQSGSITSTDPTDVRIDAAKIFMNNLSTGDEVGLLSFSGSSIYSYEDDDGNKFTTDPKGFDADFDYLADSEGGGTPLYDAAVAAISYTVDEANNQNRVVIVFTDGEDTSSGASLDDAISSSKSSQVPLHTIALSYGVNVGVLSRMAGETGGSFAKAADVRQLISYYGVLGRYLSGSGTFYRTQWRMTPHAGATFSYESGDTVSSCIAISAPGERVELPFLLEF